MVKIIKKNYLSWKFDLLVMSTLHICVHKVNIRKKTTSASEDIRSQARVMFVARADIKSSQN